MRKKVIILCLFTCVCGLLTIPAMGLGQQRGGDPTQKGGKKAKGKKDGVTPDKGGGGFVLPGQPGAQGDDDFDAWAAQRFKGVDKNGDGFISVDEMSAQARATGVWLKYDADGDGKLNFEEYKNFLREKIAVEQGLKMTGGSKGNLYESMVAINEATAALNEARVERERRSAELEKLPLVFRAGKLPPGLPEWFARYDLDHDGQIGLYEWKKFQEPLEKFFEMDRNGDGLLTAEEVLWYMKRTASSGDQSLTTASYSQNMQGFQNGGVGGFNNKGYGGVKKGDFGGRDSGVGKKGKKGSGDY